MPFDLKGNQNLISFYIFQRHRNVLQLQHLSIHWLFFQVSRSLSKPELPYKYAKLNNYLKMPSTFYTWDFQPKLSCFCAVNTYPTGCATDFFLNKDVGHFKLPNAYDPVLTSLSKVSNLHKLRNSADESCNDSNW